MTYTTENASAIFKLRHLFKSLEENQCFNTDVDSIDAIKLRVKTLLLSCPNQQHASPVHTSRYCCLVLCLRILFVIHHLPIRCPCMGVCIQQYCAWCKICLPKKKKKKTSLLYTGAMLDIEMLSLWFVFLLKTSQHLRMQRTLLIESQMPVSYFICKMLYMNVTPALHFSVIFWKCWPFEKKKKTHLFAE